MSDSDGAGTSGRPAPQVIMEHKFVQLMSANSSSQSRMDEKLVQFQVEVRPGQEEAVAKALKKPHYEKPYTFQ